MNRRRSMRFLVRLRAVLLLAALATFALSGDLRGADTLTFGKTTVGAKNSFVSADYELASGFALGHDGSISGLTAYLWGSGTNGAQIVRGVVYADNNGEPGPLVATTNEVNVAFDAARGWVDLPLPAPIDLRAGKYWLGLHGSPRVGDALTYYASDDVAAAQRIRFRPYSIGPSDPFGASEIKAREQSIFATVTPKPPPPPPPVPPVNSVLPEIAGTAREGERLTADLGGWGGTEPITFAYRWQRCDGTDCTDLEAADPRYTVATADVGKTLRVVVTASNAAGSSSATSEPTAVVAAIVVESAPPSTTTSVVPAPAAIVPVVPEQPRVSLQLAPWSTFLGYRGKRTHCHVRRGLPDRLCTPGAAFSEATLALVCATGYDSLVPPANRRLRIAVYREYGIPAGRRIRFVVDRLVPVELGGSNSIANLWPQRKGVSPGPQEKQQLAAELHRQVCAGTLDLRTEQRALARNWVAAYRRLASLPSP